MTTSIPLHHVPDEELMQYAAGTCGEAAALAIACHASLCAVCAGRLREMDAIGGAALEAAAPTPTAQRALEAVLALLDAAPANDAAALDSASARVFERLLGPMGVPRVVSPYIARGAAARWRLLVPGITRVDLAVGAPGTVARVVNLKPGLEIPLHDHAGTEYTVIFTGALADDEGRFARGDISIRAAGARHIQHVEPGQPCVALVINEGPLLPLTWKGKILDLLSKTTH